MSLRESTTETRTHFVTTIVKTPDEVGIAVPSIRAIVLDGIFHERSNADIAALIIRYHPASAPAQGAKIMKKHLGWYKSRCRTMGTPEQKALDKLIARRDEEQGLEASADVA